MDTAWLALGAICTFLFWAVVIGVVVWAIRTKPWQQVPPMGTQDPLKIAELRFAHGEISRQELEDIKAALNR